MDNNMRREIILDNYQEPFNKGLIDDNSYLKTNYKSENCIDDLDFMMKIEDSVIKDIRFDGEACAISTSASSIMIQTLIGKSVNEAFEILSSYKNMICENNYNKEKIGDLVVYEDISKQPNRINCALLPMVAVEKMLEDLKNEKQN